ncbi:MULTISPECIES: hypothetical protein [Sorangium]|uniref:Secreted protein n=1 Tax=Sorangium cellulosum (strain So ce56) TaxID=448385 RepID=A9GC66_SORC5|nr:hypothetical protein [Sorangium cellulosum]CAN96145.1 putative secreted protein [Sorangium cellulosum So ce56]
MLAPKRRSPRTHWVLLSLAAAGGALVSAGCPSPEERACDRICDCSGCSEARYLECVDKAETARADAVKASCTGSFDAYVSCVEEELECKDEKYLFDGCDGQRDSLRGCGISVFRTVCEDANDVFMACGLGLPFSTNPDECVGQILCSARCIAGMSCNGLNGIDFEESQRFNECTSACFNKPQGAEPPRGGP